MCVVIAKEFSSKYRVILKRGADLDVHGHSRRVLVQVRGNTQTGHLCYCVNVYGGFYPANYWLILTTVFCRT